MSLFPAYSSANQTPNVDATEETSGSKTNATWLSNSSYINDPSSHSPECEISAKEPKCTNETEPTTSKHESEPSPVKETKKKKRKHKRKHKKDRKEHIDDDEPKMEFTGSEEYYVDKKPERGYMSVLTLHRPACPRYRRFFKTLGNWSTKYQKPFLKRYFIKSKKQRIEFGDWNDIERLTEVDFFTKNKSFNRRLGADSGNIDLWIEFVKHQDLTHMKSTKTQIAERKIDILDKALRENPSNEELYRLYVDIIDRVYPSFEVSKILDALLAKDPTNYILWNAQILASQGSMARCNVPDVLKLYEQCMKSMYNKNRYDEVMLKLFTNCCLFMRQSGLYEQFFALIKLALTLNVSDEKFTKIQPAESDQDTLIEYEEVILQSGLPLKEIWLRIEKLRQNFYFLPCPEDRTCSDPQRIVFNEDIVHFVYPLVNKEFCFNLTIIILKLLKIPMPGYCIRNCFFTKQEHCSEFDSVEELLPVYLYRLFHPLNGFDLILFDIIKDYSIGPSYMSTHIGHEVYMKVVSEISLICSECFETRQQRNIFILLWLKLERILLLLDKMMGKITEEKAKKLRSKVKNLLKQEPNRNVLMFYTEYALIEYELGNVEAMENIFHTAIGLSKPCEDDCTKSEFYSTYIAYVETLISNCNMDKALSVLTCLALDRNIQESIETDIGETRKLLALKKLTDRLNELIFIERNVDIMALEQCFLPDYLISLMKAKIYYLFIMKNRMESIDQIEIWLKIFGENNNRHAFVRENLMEIYANILHSAEKYETKFNVLLYGVLNRGLQEFPNNLCLLRIAAVLEGLAWPKLRTLLTKSNSPISILFLVASAKYRSKKYIDSMKTIDFSFLSSDTDASEFTYKIRMSNLLKSVTNKNCITRKNSLLWRLYLRSLLDINQNFDRCHNALLAALDECPWNKVLYLDGTVYVPQEMSHIQDLIIEKQLRIYALPEELEILRTNDVNMTQPSTEIV